MKSERKIPDALLAAAQKLNSGELVLRRSREEEEGKYLDQQIDLFLSRNSDWEERLRGGGMADILEFGLEMTRTGAGNHNNLANPERITEAFNIDDPPETKCAVFNRLFQLICERSMDRFNPSLREKYMMVVTQGKYSLDLPRAKHGGGEKIIPHTFITLISVDETGNGMVFSTIDPYHAEMDGGISKKLDFTRERGVDSINPIMNLLLIDYWNGYGLSSEGERLKTLSLIEIMTVQEEAGNMGEIALVLVDQWKKIYGDFEKSKNDYDSKRILLENRIMKYKEEMEKIKNGKGSKALAEIYKQGYWEHYNGVADSYIKLRFKYDFMGELKHEFESAVVMSLGMLVGERGVVDGGEVDPRKALIFFDLMDSVGSGDIDLEPEVWRGVIDFVRKQRLENVRGWRNVIGAGGGRREWNQHLARHYKNTWNMRPVDTVSLDRDKEEVDEESNHYKYTIFRAEVLKLVREAGINDWERFLPGKVTSGSYAELLLKMLQDEG